MLLLRLVHQDERFRVQVLQAEQTDAVLTGQVDELARRLVSLGVHNFGVTVKLRV